MAEAKRDGNYVPTLIGVSNADGTTPVTIYADPTNHRLLVDLPSGTGDVVGPASSTDNAIARFNGATGKIIQNSAVTIGDTGVITVAGAFSLPIVDGTSGQVLQTDGLGAVTWEDAAGGGNVSNTGTPVNNQIAVWTAATTIEGTAGLTYDGANFQLTGDIGATGARITKGWFTDLEVTNAIAGSVTGNAATLTVADEAADTSCFIAFWTSASGSLAGKTNTNMTFDAATGIATFASTVLTTTDINGGTIDATVIGGATPATITGTTITGTTITASTGFMPDANDGAYLGQSGTAFSDLFLASGAVINFDAGNAVITHSAGILTVSTGDLRVTTAGTNAASVVTVGGTQTLTAKTLTSPAITTGTYTGAQLLAEGASIALDPTLSADGTYSGMTISGTAGATLAFGDVVYLAAVDSRWELADASAAATAGSVLVGFCVLAAAADGDPTVILLKGNIRADTAFPALTISAPVYISATAGDVTTTAPSTTDEVVRVLGFGLTADSMIVDVSPDYITIV